MKLTDKQKEVLENLKQSGLEWVRPMDIGAWDASWHSSILNQLVRKGFVEVRKRRDTLMGGLFNSKRAGREYRLVKQNERADNPV